MKVIEQIAQWHEEMTAFRRDLHMHPELGYEEVRTAGLVAERLQAWGVETHTGIGVTGVVGVIRGRSDNGRAIGLRADMDALPMPEINAFAHASRHEGKMHACGHDGHTAMLLTAARYLAQERDFDGTVYVIFQPAEEGLGGARRMIEEGLFKRFPMQAVFGMHNWPGVPVGTFAVRGGPVMASANSFRIDIHGRGSHAAKPDDSRDPIMAAVQTAQALQTFVSRNNNPLDPVVLSITQIHAGSAYNVIPSEAQLCGTVRTFAEKSLDLCEKRLHEIARLTCEAMGCTADVTFTREYPATINDEAESVFCAGVLCDLVGESQVKQRMRPAMGSEDFAFMLKELPGSYVWIGNGVGDHRDGDYGPGPCILHNGSYDFNDALIPLGASFWVELARRRLAVESVAAAA